MSERPLEKDVMEELLKKAEALQYRGGRAYCQWRHDLVEFAAEINKADLPVNGTAEEVSRAYRVAVEAIGSVNYRDSGVAAARDKLLGLAEQARNCHAPRRGRVTGFTGPGAEIGSGPQMGCEDWHPWQPDSENPDRGMYVGLKRK